MIYVSILIAKDSDAISYSLSPSLRLEYDKLGLKSCRSYSSYNVLLCTKEKYYDWNK